MWSEDEQCAHSQSAVTRAFHQSHATLHHVLGGLVIDSLP
jgi:hypothetical protein